MKKKKISIKLVLGLVILFLSLYLLFIELEPIVSNVLKDMPTFFSFNASREKSQVDTDQMLISYEEKLKIEKQYPMLDYKGRVYYNIYGKRVLDTDTVLNLSDVEIDNQLAEVIKPLPNITEIIIDKENITNDEKIALREKYPQINFKWMVEIAGEKVESNIETLDLNHKNIADIDSFKRALKLLPNLKKLDMSYTNLTNEQLGALREEFPSIRIDWVVHMSKWSVRTDAVAFSVLVYKYDYRRMTTEDIQVLKYCTELQALDLGHQAIEDITVIGDYLPNLRVLILADNKIKDISPLAKLKHLHYLELFMNNITDSSPLASCKELVDVNISFNYRFSDVSGIMDLPLLERLWLISDRISADSYNAIRERYPNVKLVTTGNGSTGSGWRTHERYFAMIDMFRNNYISEVFTQYDNK